MVCEMNILQTPELESPARPYGPSPCGLTKQYLSSTAVTTRAASPRSFAEACTSSCHAVNQLQEIVEFIRNGFILMAHKLPNCIRRAILRHDALHHTMCHVLFRQAPQCILCQSVHQRFPLTRVVASRVAYSLLVRQCVLLLLGLLSCIPARTSSKNWYFCRRLTEILAMHDWGELHLPPKHGGGVLPDLCHACLKRSPAQ